MRRRRMCQRLGSKSSESLEQFVMSHRRFEFQQVFFVFGIVFSDVYIITSKSYNCVVRLPKAQSDEVRHVTVRPA